MSNIAETSTINLLKDIEQRAAAAGMNKATLCRLANVSIATFNRWKAGTVSPTMKKINALQDVIAQADALIEKSKAS